MLVGRATLEACSSNLETLEPSQHSFIGTGKTKKNLCRGGRSQDLPDTDF